MYSKLKTMLTRILEVFEKYDHTNIPADYSDTSIVDLVTSDSVDIACYFAGINGNVSERHAEIFNSIFGTKKSADEINKIATDDESVMKHIGITFNLISETEKRLGIYTFRKTMIVPLVKFFESFAMAVISVDGDDKRAIDAYNVFFYKIESALTEIPDK